MCVVIWVLPEKANPPFVRALDFTLYLVPAHGYAYLPHALLSCSVYCIIIDLVHNS